MANVNLTIADGRSAFYQWDTNVYLLVEGVAPGDEIHFDMPNTDVPMSVKIEQNGHREICRVPDELLQTSGSFTVWVYVSDENGTRTTYETKFRVTKREKPADYTFTITDQETMQSLTERIDIIAEGLYDANVAIGLLNTTTSENSNDISKLEEGLYKTDELVHDLQLVQSDHTDDISELKDSVSALKDSIDESINETVEELKATQVKSVNGIFPDETQNIQLDIEAAVLRVLEKVGAVELVYSDDGSVYTDENDSILLF